MPERILTEDDAALYVLGGLSISERLEFEAMLAESPQLRALVRDLEDGVTGLALSAPPQRPPSGAWRQIEKSLARENQMMRSAAPFWIAFLRNGWAAAGICLAGWMLYAVVARPEASRSGTQDVKQIGQANFDQSAKEQQANPSLIGGSSQTLNPNGVGAAKGEQLLAAQKLQNAQLRRQVLELQSRLTNLSRSLADDDDMLGESNRFKMGALNPNAAAGENSNPPSPELQRAIFAALARQLGWQPASASNGAVQFVDLRPGATNAGPQQTPTPQSDVANDNNNSEAQATPISATNNLSLPSLATKDGVILAVGPSAAPIGSQVNITLPSEPGQEAMTIPFSIGENPTVLTVPNGSIITLFPAGLLTSNSIQYFTATNHP